MGYEQKEYTVRELIENIGTLPVKSVLDLGCGPGKTISIMTARGLDCTGIDVSPKSLSVAQKKASVALASGCNLPFKNGSFDIVVIKDVLHHIPDPVAVLSQARKCLKNDGYLWILEPVEDDPVLRFGRKVLPYWEGVRVESRLYASQLQKSVLDAGFVHEKQGGIKGDFPAPYLFWMKETIRRKLILIDVSPEKNKFLKKWLGSRVVMNWTNNIIYYWCLARKGR